LQNYSTSNTYTKLADNITAKNRFSLLFIPDQKNVRFYISQFTTLQSLTHLWNSWSHSSTSC